MAFPLFELPKNLIVNVLGRLDNTELVDFAVVSRDSLDLYRETRQYYHHNQKKMKDLYLHDTHFKKTMEFRKEAEEILANWSYETGDIHDANSSSFQFDYHGNIISHHRTTWHFLRRKPRLLDINVRFLNISRHEKSYCRVELNYRGRTHKLDINGREGLDTLNQPDVWKLSSKRLLRTKCFLERHLILEAIYLVYMDTCENPSMSKHEFLYHLDKIL